MWWRNSSLAISSIFSSSHVSLFIQKSKETGSSFHISLNECHDQNAVSNDNNLLTNPTTKKIHLDSVLMKASRKKLNTKSNTRFPQSSSLIIFMPKIAPSMILVLHDSHSMRRELRSTSHHAGNEMRLVTNF